MAWVLYEGRLYCLPTQSKIDQVSFRAFQERNHEREVVIHAPEGGSDLVPVPELHLLREEGEA